MKTVIAYGTFDYFHYGHYNFLKQAKATGDYLIVGVSTDELCRQKGKCTILDQDKRKEIIEALSFVDMVIFEYEFDQKITDIDKYNVNILFEGEDYKDIFLASDTYTKIKDKCQVIFGKRTIGISTSELKDKLAQQAELDAEATDNLRKKTNNLRKDKFSNGKEMQCTDTGI